MPLLLLPISDFALNNYKVVREVLCELEIPYLQKTVARGSPKRQELIDCYGAFQVSSDLL